MENIFLKNHYIQSEKFKYFAYQLHELVLFLFARNTFFLVRKIEDGCSHYKQGKNNLLLGGLDIKQKNELRQVVSIINVGATTISIQLYNVQA